MYNVPKHMWSKEGFSLLASTIGKPVCMDKTTEKKQMLTFARICIEVSAEKELPDNITIKTNGGKELTITLEYPWRPLMCLKCHVFGHNLQGCDKGKPGSVKKVTVQTENREKGEWRQPQKQWKRKEPTNGTKGGYNPQQSEFEKGTTSHSNQRPSSTIKVTKILKAPANRFEPLKDQNDTGDTIPEDMTGKNEDDTQELNNAQVDTMSCWDSS
ncbi:hypothetical protein FRX31_024197 [Thalictrum thalictroides]|uniref:DUF4283 domain-containing protein n=1 Tax=Thalictrum thalictroides TaxID=46969 RepID=A0A7J6VPU0_THATH|nr:hypothetical protein FRX31_024197 [Thalictrum thalictroides]